MKLFVKLMMAVLVLAFLLPFTLLKNDQGNTLMSFSDISMPELELPELPDLSPSKDLIPSQVSSGGMDTFYKWYDPRGNVQFTSEPPPDGVAYTVKQYDPNANVIQGVKLPAGNTNAAATSSNASANPASASSSQGQESSNNTESIGKLFEGAEKFNNLINQRTSSQNDTIN